MAREAGGGETDVTSPTACAKSHRERRGNGGVGWGGSRRLRARGAQLVIDVRLVGLFCCCSDQDTRCFEEGED